mmetsp:Transcript_8071/g.13555  ORF Transcript_8071/g.13555 Transcript_8071/m.13555 type:complete len:102 (-) Transcript_8071:151-456(-)
MGRREGRWELAQKEEGFEGSQLSYQQLRSQSRSKSREIMDNHYRELWGKFEAETNYNPMKTFQIHESTSQHYPPNYIKPNKMKEQYSEEPEASAYQHVSYN